MKNQFDWMEWSKQKRVVELARLYKRMIRFRRLSDITLAGAIGVAITLMAEILGLHIHETTIVILSLVALVLFGSAITCHILAQRQQARGWDISVLSSFSPYDTSNYPSKDFINKKAPQ